MLSRIVLAATALAWPLCFAAAHAASWTVCDYTVKTIRVHPKERTLEAVITAGHPGNPEVCQPEGSALRFRPEAPDYQSELPRRAWPRVQQQSQLRYRHLDGICKGDGQNRPCRIVHHSILRNF